MFIRKSLIDLPAITLAFLVAALVIPERAAAVQSPQVAAQHASAQSPKLLWHCGTYDDVAAVKKQLNGRMKAHQVLIASIPASKNTPPSILVCAGHGN